MYRVSLLLLACLILAGCNNRPDPRQREGFVDTGSDPSKVLQTMESPDGGNANQPEPPAP